MSTQAAPLRAEPHGGARAPFLDRSLACPVCGRMNTHRDIRAQAYIEEAWDSDHRVSRYRWLNPAFAGIHPPFYAVWHCPACLYTDLKEAFQRPPARPERFVRLRLVFLRRLRDQDLGVFLLGSMLGEDQRTLESALAAHLLALYIQEMPPEEDQDYQKLGRLYLRTAWLYREPPRPPGRTTPVRVEAVRDLARLEGALRILAEFAESPGEVADPLAALRAEARALGAEAQRLLGQTRALAQSLGEGTFPSEGGEAGTGDPVSFLERIGEYWPAVPRTEPDGLRGAVAAYQRYYEGPEGPGGSAGLAVLELIVDLHRRLGAWDQILRGAGELARRANEERKALQQALLVNKELTEIERRRTRAKIDSLANLLDQAKALYDEADQRLRRNAPPAPTKSGQ
jgi:hypothetical protein